MGLLPRGVKTLRVRMSEGAPAKAIRVAVIWSRDFEGSQGDAKRRKVARKLETAAKTTLLGMRLRIRL